jgi:hypothetical protein
MFEINWWAIVAVAVANMIIGTVWYHPKVFGGAWMRLVGITSDMTAAAKRRMPAMMGIAFLSSVIMAYVLAHFAIAWAVFDVISAIELGFWVWLGFVATTQISVVLWEMKPWKLFFINTGYSFVSFITAAVVLFLFA